MRRINRVQRLARKEEKDIIKRIFLLSVISVVLIFILLTVGITALGKFADLLDVVFKGGDTSEEEQILTPPILSNVSDTTNDENLKVSGFSSSGEKVEIYLDGEKAAEAPLESGQFEAEIMLKSGDNSIAAKTILGDTSSDLTEAIIVTLDKKDPDLEVATPVEGQSFFSDNRAKVEGKTEPDAQVFVNGFLANVTTSGDFDVTVPLVEGDNDLEIKALDEAGNSKTVTVRVNFRK